MKIKEKLFDLWETLLYEYLCRFWDWFWYYRRGMIKFHIVNCGDHFKVSASDGKSTVWNCYGSTLEEAKKIAIWRLKNKK